MVDVCLLHGWDSGYGAGFFPWLIKEIISKGYNPIMPKLPERYLPEDNIISILDDAVGKPNKDLYILGYSAGGHLGPRYCEHLYHKYSRDVKIGGMVLVAPFKKVNFKAVRAGIIKNLLESNDEKMIANLDEILKDARKVSDLWGKNEFDWGKIRHVSPNNHCLFSDYDPFVSNDNHSIFEIGLSAKIKVIGGAGHFNDENRFNEFKDLRDVLFDMIYKNTY